MCGTTKILFLESVKILGLLLVRRLFWYVWRRVLHLGPYTVPWRPRLSVSRRFPVMLFNFILIPTRPSYVGKFIANLTLAQLRTLDCGGSRQVDFREPTRIEATLIFETHITPALQLTYPGTRISTLEEVFEFVECADPEHLIRCDSFFSQ